MAVESLVEPRDAIERKPCAVICSFVSEPANRSIFRVFRHRPIWCGKGREHYRAVRVGEWGRSDSQFAEQRHNLEMPEEQCVVRLVFILRRGYRPLRLFAV